MNDEITIHNDENKPIKTAFAVTQARVEHYNDVIDYMTRAAVDRFVTKHKKKPSPQSVAFLQKELVRLVVISRNITMAQKLEINESTFLTG